MTSPGGLSGGRLFSSRAGRGDRSTIGTLRTAQRRSPMHEQRIRRKVEYADTDMSGIVHFSRFLVFMENAEHAFLKAVGPGVQWRDAEGREIGWPRVAVSCEYLAPARFGDELEIRVRVLRKGTRSLTYGVEIQK